MRRLVPLGLIGREVVLGQPADELVESTRLCGQRGGALADPALELGHLELDLGLGPRSTILLFAGFEDHFLGPLAGSSEASLGRGLGVRDDLIGDRLCLVGASLGWGCMQGGGALR